MADVRIYHAYLSLRLNGQCVGNSFNADGKVLITVTGVNGGGKSKFVRNLGKAQLITQAGMYVVAGKSSADLRHGVFTRVKREEDKGMAGESLKRNSRTSEIIDQIPVGDLLTDHVIMIGESELRISSDALLRIHRAEHVLAWVDPSDVLALES